MDRLNKAAAVSLVAFSIVLAAFIGSRMDQLTIALLGGTFIGLLISIPSVLLIVVLALRRRDGGESVRYERPRFTHMPPSPPQDRATPTLTDAPYYGEMHSPPPMTQARASFAAPEYVLPTTRRRFYLIGESGEISEIEAPPESDEPNGAPAEAATHL